jgi:hypothetical protein
MLATDIQKNFSFLTQSTAVPTGNVAKEVHVLTKFFFNSISMIVFVQFNQKNSCMKLHTYIIRIFSFLTQSTAVPTGNVAKEVHVLTKFFFNSISTIVFVQFESKKFMHEAERKKIFSFAP